MTSPKKKKIPKTKVFTDVFSQIKPHVIHSDNNNYNNNSISASVDEEAKKIRGNSDSEGEELRKTESSPVLVKKRSASQNEQSKLSTSPKSTSSFFDSFTKKRSHSVVSPSKVRSPVSNVNLNDSSNNNNTSFFGSIGSRFSLHSSWKSRSTNSVPNDNNKEIPSRSNGLNKEIPNVTTNGDDLNIVHESSQTNANKIGHESSQTQTNTNKIGPESLQTQTNTNKIGHESSQTKANKITCNEETANRQPLARTIFSFQTIKCVLHLFLKFKIILITFIVHYF